LYDDFSTHARSVARLMHPTRQAILLTVGAVFLFSLQDGIGKYLITLHSALLIVWSRYALQSAIFVVVYGPKYGRALVQTKQPKLQLLRGLSALVSTILFVTALKYVPIGEATAVLFLSPIMIVVLSHYFLKERTNRWQWLSVVLGLIGVALVARPTSAIFTPAILLPLASAFFVSIYQMLTRKVVATDSSVASNFLTCTIASLALGIGLPFFWEPITWSTAFLLMIQAILVIIGHLFLTNAFQRTTAATIAPFSYIQILFASVMGILFFGHSPDYIKFIGMSVIIASGVLLMLRTGRS